MFIQLDLEEIFDVESPRSDSHGKDSSQLSAVEPQPRQSQQRKPLHYQLNSSDLFRESSTGSGSHEQPSADDTFPSVATDPPSQFDMPGERLYYESKQNLVRKLKDIERYKYELSQQEKNQLTFAPHINKNTKKILASRQENPETALRALKRKEEKLKEFEFMEKQKNFQVEKECTFKPKIAKKTEELTRNRSDNVFHNLYREGHRRDIRLMVKKGEQPETPRVPDGQKIVQEFLERNDQYLQKTQKKLKMLEEEARQYDLKSGEKLFSPKISKMGLRGDCSRSGAIFNKHVSLHNLNSKLREKVESDKQATGQPTKQALRPEEEYDRPQPPILQSLNDPRFSDLSEGHECLQHGQSEGPDIEACFDDSADVSGHE